MYEIPWFKTETTIFSNRKIQILLKLPEGDTYFRMWIQLIALAVECNNKGRLEIGENNPMTIQNFSKIMGKSNKEIEKISRIRNVNKRRGNISDKKLGQVSKYWKIWKVPNARSRTTKKISWKA